MGWGRRELVSSPRRILDQSHRHHQQLAAAVENGGGVFWDETGTEVVEVGFLWELDGGEGGICG